MSTEEKTPINIQQAVPFFMVKDMVASLEFYTQKLGFNIAIEWEPRGKIEWCWLKRDAIAIMLQEPRDKSHWLYHTEELGRAYPSVSNVPMHWRCITSLPRKALKLKSRLWVTTFG